MLHLESELRDTRRAFPQTAILRGCAWRALVRLYYTELHGETAALFATRLLCHARVVLSATASNNVA